MPRILLPLSLISALALSPALAEPKQAKSELPTIGAPALKAKPREEKPKTARPFGELEGWSSAAEAEKKKMPTPPPDQSSTGYKKPPIGFDSGGNIGMGMSF
jgi:hypothetical protein